MVEYKETPESQLLELGSWQNIIHSEDWRVFLKLLKNHQDYLQSKVNSFLEKHEDRRAGEELAKLNDCSKIISIVQHRIEEIRKNIS